ncbi:MAG TPA: DNA methyltransferase, partial [Anaeromyxobacteraceae bacterium]|nr:DNA methyltransferase [Anaeromyxobacteraceae bacterium]
MSPRPPRPDAAPYTLVCGDALDVLRGMEAGSVNLFLTDPPYYRVKGAAWDRQWDTPAAFLAWMDALLAEMARVLAPNGSLYLFASPQMAARVEVLVGERFRVLNSIRWEKAEGWHRKTEPAALRSYLSPWEAVIFAEQQGADAFSPLGDAIRTARQAAGLRATDVDVALG